MNAVRERVEEFVKQCESSQAELAETTREKMERLTATLTGRLDTEVARLRSELVDRRSMRAVSSPP